MSIKIRTQEWKRNETKPLMRENNQRNYNVETNNTHGTSRTETCNCPSCSFEPRSLKNTTQSYSYSNSFEEESERVERKEKERYERRLIREHLRQKSRDEPYEYCLESFEYAGRNLADTDETDGGITVSDWSEPEPNDDNEEDEIFVGYFEDSEVLQEEDEQFQMIQDLYNQLEFIATWDKQIKSQHTFHFA